MRSYLVLTAGLLLFGFMAGQANAQQTQAERLELQKTAQTGMKFLDFSVDARAAALGDAMTAARNVGSESLFYNPASMARLDKTSDVSLNLVQWIGDIQYSAGSFALRPADGLYGTFGLSVMAVDYGQFLGTVRADNQQGFVNTGKYSPTSMALGAGYARQFTDRFSAGAQVKYARQDLGSSIISRNDQGSVSARQQRSVGTVAVDFGMSYRTGFRGLIFAVRARNFSQELTYVDESFELPLNVAIGLSADLTEVAQMQSDRHGLFLNVSGTHPRDFSEQVKIGGEYVFMDLLSLRAGYIYPEDEQSVSLGAGIHTDLGGIGFQFDYSYTRFGRFGAVNHLTANFSL